VHGQAATHVVGQVFVHVLLVLPRHDQLANAVAPRRQNLFFDAADRQHAAGERDLAGHRDVGAHRSTRQR